MKILSAFAAAALVPATLLAVPAHAAAPIGCAADPELEQRVLVKQKPVRTQDGERFGVLRLFAGEVYDEPLSDGAQGGYYPAYCLDLVVADKFDDRMPRQHGSVEGDGFVDYLDGRAVTGQVTGGAGTELEGQVLTITYELQGRNLRAKRVMRVTIPAIG